LSRFFGVQHYWQEGFIIFLAAWTHPTAIAGSRSLVLARGHVYLVEETNSGRSHFGYSSDNRPPLAPTGTTTNASSTAQ
jgi:hypothetical protein